MSLIVTLGMDAGSQAHFNRLREEHYPPERNLIDAHVTLFHSLPDEAAVWAALAAEAAVQARFAVEVAGVRSLGRGVAYVLDGAALPALHRRLAARFADYLTAQDRQRFQPHIVVQNKVTAEAARALLARLQAGWVRRRVEGTGLSVWHYRGGPWEAAGELPFAG